MLALASTYTYKGESAGYTVQTGPSANSPISRSLQSKFDEIASVKDFGAVGDGLTDDTAAINRALYEIFCRDNNPQVRRGLFFPAGVYMVTDEVKIPAFATLWGDGQNSSIIKQTGSAVVARSADSLQQIGANIGNNGALPPTYIDIQNMTFEQTTAGYDVVLLNSTSNSRFQRVQFIGNVEDFDTVGDGTANILIESTAINKSENLVFEQCIFSNDKFAILADDDINAVLVNASKFINFHKAIKLGENTTGNGSSIIGPRSFKVTNSYFDSIYSAAIHAYGVKNIYSAFNFYDDVGQHLINTPVENVLIFEDDDCASVYDSFSRVDSNLVAINNAKNIYIQPKIGITNGRLRQRPAVQITLDDNETSPTSSGITFDDTSELAVKMYYTAQRAGDTRHGTLTITGTVVSDEFQEDGADIGLEFSVSISGGLITLNYETTNIGENITFTYNIEHMNY